MEVESEAIQDALQSGFDSLMDNFTKLLELKLGEQKATFEQRLQDLEISWEEKYANIMSAFVNCPTGWITADGFCIFASKERATFDDAVKKCAAWGNSKLYEPSSQQENDFVFRLITDNDNAATGAHWIGITDRDEENK